MLSLALKQRVGPTWQTEITRVTYEFVNAFARAGRTCRMQGRWDPKLLAHIDGCLREFFRTTERPLRIVMQKEQLYLDGELLPYHRETHATLLPLLEGMNLTSGGIEVYAQPDFTPQMIEAWQEWFTRPQSVDTVAGGDVCYVRARPRDGLRETFRALFDDAAALRVQKAQTDTRTFAATLVALSYVFDRAGDVAWSREYAPAVLRRSAAVLTTCAAPEFVQRLGLAYGTRLSPSLSVRAGHAAILAAAVARQGTHDRRMVRDVALAALLVSFARAALGKDVKATTSTELAAMTSACSIALGFAETHAAIFAHEAAHLTAGAHGVGAAATGQRASFPARVVGIAEAFVEDDEAAAAADARIGAIAYRTTETADHTILRMLAVAVGHLPSGTSVELETGETATVVREGDDEDVTSWLAVVMSAEGQILANPRRVRLMGGPKIARVVSTEGWARAPSSATLGDEESTAQTYDGSSSASLAMATTVKEAASHATSAAIAKNALAGLPEWSEPTEQSLPPEHAKLFVPSSQAQSHAAPSPSLAPTGAASVPPGATMPPDDPSSRVATATGSLTTSPLPHLVVYMLDHRLKGSVVLTEPTGQEHVLYFRRGVPVAVKHGAGQHRIGEILFARVGLLEPQLAEAAERAKNTSRLIGEALADEGRIDSATVASAVRLQIVLRLESLANLSPQTTFAFYKGADRTGHGRGRSVHVHPLDAVMAAVRAWKFDERINALVDRLRGQKLALHSDARLEWIWMSAEELRVVRELGKGQLTLDELLKSDVADERVVRRVIYAMAVTRQFAALAPAKKPMGASIAPSPLMMDETSMVAGAGESSDAAPLVVVPLVAALSNPIIERDLSDTQTSPQPQLAPILSPLPQLTPPVRESGAPPSPATHLIPRRPSIRPKSSLTPAAMPAPVLTAQLVGPPQPAATAASSDVAPSLIEPPQPTEMAPTAGSEMAGVQVRTPAPSSAAGSEVAPTASAASYDAGQVKLAPVSSAVKLAPVTPSSPPTPSSRASAPPSAPSSASAISSTAASPRGGGRGSLAATTPSAPTPAVLAAATRSADAAPGFDAFEDEQAQVGTAASVNPMPSASPVASTAASAEAVEAVADRPSSTGISAAPSRPSAKVVIRKKRITPERG